MTATKTFSAQFVCTETDDVMDTFEFQALNAEHAEELAWEEAEFQGYHVGVVKEVTK